MAGSWEGGSLSGSGHGSKGFKSPSLIRTLKAADRDMYSGANTLWPRGGYFEVCGVLLDAPAKGLAGVDWVC